MTLIPAGRRKVPSDAVTVEKTHDNTSQEVITITTDKLKLALMEHLGRLEKKDSWQMPLTFLIGVIVVFCSSSFKPALGLSADTWSAIFAVFGAICVGWLLRTLRYANKSASLEQLIQVIKNQQ